MLKSCAVIYVPMLVTSAKLSIEALPKKNTVTYTGYTQLEYTNLNSVITNTLQSP